MRSVLDRFTQIEPKVLLTVDGYTYGGKLFGRRAAHAELRARLLSVQASVIVPYRYAEFSEAGAGRDRLAGVALHPADGLRFEPCPSSTHCGWCTPRHHRSAQAHRPWPRWDRA
jgi:acetoacetyl-CoA synthetase